MSKSKRKAVWLSFSSLVNSLLRTVYFIALDPDWGFEKFDSSEWHKKIVFHSEFSEHGE